MFKRGDWKKCDLCGSPHDEHGGFFLVHNNKTHYVCDKACLWVLVNETYMGGELKWQK
jgi:hypothetical protein